MNEPRGLDQYRRWFRRPDKSFWFELFNPMPTATREALIRRARLARYSLGFAAVLTLPYILGSLLVAPQDLRYLILVNVVCLFAFSCGMWAASLGADRAARMWLMSTLTAQVAVLQWMSGSLLGVSIYAFVVAALARVLFAPEEKAPRAFFVLCSILILLAGFFLTDQAYVDFSALPRAMLLAMKVANTLMTCFCVLLLLGVSDREVLRSEAGLTAERDRSDQLLHVILPKKIASQLRENGGMIANSHPEVSVLFADIAGFTPWAAQQSPESVVRMLEKIFSRFDVLVERAGAEKIKTIGDAYMVVSGAPESRADHAATLAQLALDFMAEMKNLRSETGTELDVRIGIHSGPVIAGVIGTVRFCYDVWGDTVNTASRMESQGEPGRIQLSANTMALLVQGFHGRQRGMVDIKGKGMMETWWLEPGLPALRE